MAHLPHTLHSLTQELNILRIGAGDGVFVHASMGAIGETVGGARTVIEALLSSVGDAGLVGMPGFSSDAYFPATVDPEHLIANELSQIEEAVLGFDPAKSPTSGMGIIAETFRTWPGTLRSSHPAVSVCLNGLDAARFASCHSLAWATGPQTPLGMLRDRRRMKIMMIGVGWNRCSALHTAETLADTKRTKMRRFKSGGVGSAWVETPDVADDLDRLFPHVGEAFERAGHVRTGCFGSATCKICAFSKLIDFAADWINRANIQSGDHH